MKKLISLIIIFSLSLSLFALPSYSADEYVSRFQNDIDEIKAMGIMQGDENGDFNPENSLTRAEFAKIISTIIGFTSDVTPSEESGFYDLGSDYWAYKYIYYVVSSGYMKGYADGSFRPNEAISGNEAVKVLVCLAGYEFRAKASGGYPSGYALTANQLGITNGISVDMSEYIYREEAARLINNTLDVPYMEVTGVGDGIKYSSEKSKTLLSELLSMERGTGVVSANDIAALGIAAVQAENRISINGLSIKFSDPSARDYLGYKVRYIYKKDNSDEDNKNLIYIRDNDTDSTVVNIEDFDSYKDNSFTYEIREGTLKSLNISQSADFILNGENVSYSDGLFDFELGTVTLIKSFTNQVDVVSIKKYEVMSAWIIDGGNKIITDKYDASLKLDFGKQDVTYNIFDYEGKELDFAKIRKGNIITFLRGVSVVNAYVGGISENGRVESIADEDEIILSGKTLKRDYYSVINNNISAGDNLTVYKDLFGNIADCELISHTMDMYYLIKLKENTVADESTVKAKIFGIDGIFREVVFPDKVTINGNVYKNITYSKLIELIGNEEGGYDQLVGLKLEDNNITELETAKTIETLDAENSDGFCLLYPLRSRNYLSESYCYDFEIYVDANTPYFVIPVDIENANEKDFRILNYRSFSTTTSLAGYAFSKNKALSDAVVVKTSSASSAFEGHDIVGVVSSISDTLSEDGEKLTRIHVFKGNYLDRLTERDIFAYEEDELTDEKNGYKISELKPGDAVKIMYDTTNSRLEKFQVYYKADEDKWLGTESESYTAINRIYQRKIIDIKDDYVVLKPLDADRKELYPISKFMIIIAEKNPSGKYLVRQGESGNIVPGDNAIIQTISRSPFSLIIYK